MIPRLAAPVSRCHLGGAFVLALGMAALLGVFGAGGADADGRNLPRQRLQSLYSPAGVRVRAAHEHPAHARLACASCHVTSGAGAASDAPMPTKAQCEPCHTGAHAVGRPAERCRLCHLEAAPPFGSLSPSAPRVPSVHFSHVRHRETPCGQCHGASGTRPTMAACIDCHRRRRLSTACRTCHAAQPDGRLVTSFEAGLLVPSGPLLGMAHDRDWLIRHRWVGADHGDTCAACHTERDCEQCHDAPRPPRRVHAGDFLSLHPQQARRAPASCTSCHTVQRFCLECHARLGLSLGAAPAVGATGRVHPNATTWIRGGGHAIAARRNLTSCVSCHAESDCVPCHGATGVGVGAGISPHGPDFQATCGAARRANDRACRSCHGPGTPRCP